MTKRIVTVLLILCLLGTLLAGCTSQQYNEPIITNPEDGATTNTDTDQENTTTATVNNKKTTTINDVTVGDTTKGTSTDTKKTSTTKVKKTTTKVKKTTTTVEKTTTKVKKTTTKAKKTTTTVKKTTTKAKKAQVGTMLGKTMKQVRKTYGEGEPTYYRGASGIYYDDLCVSFITNLSYDDDIVPDQAPVCSILCAGPQLLVLGNLPGAATYDELVAAIGSEVKLAKPKETYDAHDGEDLTFHFLSFTYRGQPATIRWYDNPYTTNWDELALHLTDSQSATVTTYFPTTTTTPGDTLAKKIFQYVQDNGLYGCDSVRYEIYHEDQTIMTIQLYDDWGYYSAGIDYYKDSGTLEIYNISGRMVDQVTFWP